MSDRFKRIILVIRKRIKCLCHNVTLYVGRGFMMLCVVEFLMITCTNIMHRAPIFAYVIEELRLPLTLKYSGCIKVYDEKNRLEPIPISVKIGGYQKLLYNGEEVELVFSATNIKNIPIIIEYQNEGKSTMKLEYISYQKRQYNIECDFEYYD